MCYRSAAVSLGGPQHLHQLAAVRAKRAAVCRGGQRTGQVGDEAGVLGRVQEALDQSCGVACGSGRVHVVLMEPRASATSRTACVVPSKADDDREVGGR
jgi:hypothetical protein